MRKNIIAIVFLFSLILRIKAECTTDCANGWKIITDVYYCKSIFGDANCNNDATCITDFNNYKACALTGCFGQIGNLASISQYNDCVQKCTGTTQPVKDFALSFNNCMNIASSAMLLFEVAISIFLYLIYF
ncbi:transmembrane protein, putative (macronuclear) [Tetrahymena thermophila SB210]|uniref:Transmembrane protein, putative n=1 Tax=Tetrahymena thermophila (strain SB210) TaxID=312017 RepID=W7XEH9_TETTS|nr:transmembrane protein, putative [Tetrahymena thermophila SB210]EWS75078.1 transmembrane protein, putative [Tetrahymena thermophila SB210]|eukprot:XP_012652391.1 transmembrane protein, putative [Tetrahymena thermophila SB210]